MNPPDAPYFESLKELDIWADAPGKKLDNILKYTPRRSVTTESANGKLLVCHDYKGGYTEKANALSYTFNFWSSCDIFVYFSHHRVTIPPPGWITAAHRQGVKMLGTLIFEGGAEQDCLRLVIGNLPESITGPARPSTPRSSFRLSAHYARVLADLAYQRGFDGYLLNFECPLQGSFEQTRDLVAWITLLQSEILAKVGPHGETLWYDSVIINGNLRWQDRLNSVNLPFFLSSTGFFTNYTWPAHYPSLIAQYFLSLSPTLSTSKKALNQIYTGVDVWGRGSHGGGGFGCYKALDHIAPSSLGLSVALFGQAWTWESEQDKPGWTWDAWWAYERKLWAGPSIEGEVVDVPPMPRRDGEPECAHGPFVPLVSYFQRQPPPDPVDLPFHTTFCPGVGRKWFVDGVEVYQSEHGGGWTDVEKQTTVGDLVWPRPVVEWESHDEDESRDDKDLPVATASLNMADAWNGGSCLKFTLSDPPLFLPGEDDTTFRHIWLPIQSLCITPSTSYEATVVFKLESSSSYADLDIGLSVKMLSPTASRTHLQVSPNTITNTDLPGGWTKLSVQFTFDTITTDTEVAIGLLIAIITEGGTERLDVPILVGQINVYATPPPSFPAHTPSILWADFTPTVNSPTTEGSLRGILTWEPGTYFPPLPPITITSPEDPVPAFGAMPTSATMAWFPEFLYFNVYVVWYGDGTGSVDPDNAEWLGTTGLDGEGRRGRFVIGEQVAVAGGDRRKARFYVRGVSDRGVVLGWEQSVFVDVDVER